MRSLIILLSLLVLNSSFSLQADELNPANQAIEAAKAKTRASGSPYGDQTLPNTRLTYPGALSIEFLGRTGLWSVNYDMTFQDQISAGFGIGSVGVGGNSASGSTIDTQAWMIPVYMNYYFAKSGSTFFGTLGATLVTNNNKVKNGEAETSDIEFGSSSVIPNFGAGYEMRTDNGFLFRVAGYGLIADNFSPWFGASFGFAF